MNLSVSCRIAEGFLSKEEAIMTLEELADLAVSAGFQSLCMRASQIGVQSSAEEVERAREILDSRQLGVSMISGDFDIVYNNEKGPDCLRKITPYLDLAERLGSSLIRVCLKEQDDIAPARSAADEARERGIQLAHQCHIGSIFETVDQIIESLDAIDRPNFGLIYEAANLEQCQQDYGPDTIRRLAPWIRNVYLQNQRLDAEGAVTLETRCAGPVSFDIIEIPEAGGIDFASVFDGLKQVGYEGPITVHQSAPEDGATSPLESAVKTADFLRRFG
ncbi:MAG: sugar phosphate isomerase/epimerase [Verrucomicrobiales bacterium]|nr:sugar phosphate isomerase/epimerase [Verrucomicrobiales bacterium]